MTIAILLAALACLAIAWWYRILYESGAWMDLITTDARNYGSREMVT